MKIKFKVKGMHCKSCEKIISKELFKLEGINKFDIDYATEKAEVVFDESKTNFSEIKKKIEAKNYICEEQDDEFSANTKITRLSEQKQDWLYWSFLAVGLLLAVYFAWNIYGKFTMPAISQNMGYGLLFLVGLMTGFHCIGMCGGFVVSYTTKGVQEGKKPYQLHLSYAVGKTLSYTIMGALFGLLGSLIAFTPFLRGMAGILAGLFLILFGLKMLNIFPALRKLSWHFPDFVNKFRGHEEKKFHHSPLIIGLLNGLMIACGPLQAVYIMAAGTGSMIEGAKMLFIFGLGTLPVMLGFGYLTSIISSKATHKILKASGIIVLILGLVMLNRGLALTGSGYDLNTLSTKLSTSSGINQGSVATSGIAVIKNGYQEIRMDVLSSGWKPDKFVLQKDVPVKWIINGKELNGCNSAIQVPKLGLSFDIKKGEQVIEFTPTEEGTISWSCAMGMIPGVFIVQKEAATDSAQTVKVLNEVQVPQGGSCGGGGGCGCGGAR
ncbi:sulfite exporter TauE/SafE family protein [Candidatus Woesearchaeota archaeon]|nr:sulfite exporter TauE/SafE family protein [Candidatus Woesearchaeota archaeon]